LFPLDYAGFPISEESLHRAISRLLRKERLLIAGGPTTTRPSGQGQTSQAGQNHYDFADLRLGFIDETDAPNLDFAWLEVG
jgi:hypothetical protein